MTLPLFNVEGIGMPAKGEGAFGPCTARRPPLTESFRNTTPKIIRTRGTFLGTPPFTRKNKKMIHEETLNLLRTGEIDGLMCRKCQKCGAGYEEIFVCDTDFAIARVSNRYCGDCTQKMNEKGGD